MSIQRGALWFNFAVRYLTPTVRKRKPAQTGSRRVKIAPNPSCTGSEDELNNDFIRRT